MPRRIQMTRQRPWRHEHPDAVIVARPSKWGNPFAAKIPRGEAGQATAAREHLVNDYRQWLTMPLELGRCPGGVDALYGVPYAKRPSLEEIRAELAGRDLACWCPLDQPCHGDVLLELANGGA